MDPLILQCGHKSIVQEQNPVDDAFDEEIQKPLQENALKIVVDTEMNRQIVKVFHIQATKEHCSKKCPFLLISTDDKVKATCKLFMSALREDGNKLFRCASCVGGEVREIK